MADKTRRYLAAGSVMVVIVNSHSKAIEVHAPSAAVIHLTLGDALDLGAVLPGLSIPVAAIFRWSIDLSSFSSQVHDPSVHGAKLVAFRGTRPAERSRPLIPIQLFPFLVDSKEQN